VTSLILINLCWSGYRFSKVHFFNIALVLTAFCKVYSLTTHNSDKHASIRLGSFTEIRAWCGVNAKLNRDITRLFYTRCIVSKRVTR